jgi:hypothetical protein
MPAQINPSRERKPTGRQSRGQAAGLSGGTGMIKVAIVVGERTNQGPSGPPIFELPAVPEIGSYITCTPLQPAGEDLVVRRVEWRLWQAVSEEGAEAKPGSLLDVLIFCDRVDPKAQAFDPEAMLRSWLAAFPQRPEEFRDLLRRFLSSLGGSGPKGFGVE